MRTMRTAPGAWLARTWRTGRTVRTVAKPSARRAGFFH
jgi:hypothetical protein